jgi:hypothetical protein
LQVVQRYQPADIRPPWKPAQPAARLRIEIVSGAHRVLSAGGERLAGLDAALTFPYSNAPAAGSGAVVHRARLRLRRARRQSPRDDAQGYDQSTGRTNKHESLRKSCHDCASQEAQLPASAAIQQQSIAPVKTSRQGNVGAGPTAAARGGSQIARPFQIDKADNRVYVSGHSLSPQGSVKLEGGPWSGSRRRSLIGI